MSGYVIWFVLGCALLAAELMTGTFYLLVLAVAAGVAGLTALAGAGLASQLVVAAAIGFGGSLWLRSVRAGRAAGAAASLQQLDVGQTLRVEQWNANRSARASYRGAQWDVQLAAGEEPVPGEFVIREVQANRLVVGRRPAA